MIETWQKKNKIKIYEHEQRHQYKTQRVSDLKHRLLENSCKGKKKKTQNQAVKNAQGNIRKPEKNKYLITGAA